MKLGMKELRVKLKIKKYNGKFDREQNESDAKKQAVDMAANTQKDYAHKEGLQKEQIAGAAAEPPAPLPDAEEMANKQRVVDKRIQNAKDDEMAELAKGGDDRFVALLQERESMSPDDDDEDEAGASASAEKVVPKPWEKPMAPYGEWGLEAEAVPNKVLEDSLKKPAPPPKVFVGVNGVDVKKYRQGREGDEIGMKLGMKELRVKLKIKKYNGKFDREQNESDAKKQAVDMAANT